MNYILAVDQGTHASRALVLDTHGQVISQSLRAVALAHPRPGWVEQDAVQLAASVQAAIKEALHTLTAHQRAAVSACGISSQRSTVLAWRANSTPVSTAINWQDTRGEPQLESVRSRVRPILMSTLTSVGGMLPLVLMPGAGSELYRGLGAVVVGGLTVSTVFTTLLVPAVLSVVFELRQPEPDSKSSAEPAPA